MRRGPPPEGMLSRTSQRNARMQQQLDQYRQQAREFERKGNLAAAKATYESLLRVDASHADVWLRLSALDQLTGNYRGSCEHALKAASAVAANRSWKHLAAVARRLMPFDEHHVVRELIVGSDWQAPEVLADAPVLAQQLWLTNDFADALALIEAASAPSQSNPLLHYSLADALRYCGKMAEATAEYERCLQLAPNYAYAHWSLAYHQKASPPGSRVDRIKRAQAATSSDSPEQPYLYYALFKELDDAGDTAQAWGALQTGARIKRRSIRYDAAREQRGVVALQGLVGQDFLRGAVAQSAAAETHTPIFVVGMPRTGTTLLERILSNHDQVATAGELNEFGSAMCWESGKFLGSALDAALNPQIGALDFAKVGQRYLQRTESRRAGRSHLIDKNPANFFNAGYIAKALPQAKIVCLSRSPMDACFSNLKELFSGDAYGYSYDLAELALHYQNFEALLRHWQDTMPANFHVVRYEALVSDPAGTTRSIAEFCGFDFDPASVDITQNTLPVSTASSSQVRQPIHASGVGAWERYSEQLSSLRARLSGS